MKGKISEKLREVLNDPVARKQLATALLGNGGKVHLSNGKQYRVFKK